MIRIVMALVLLAGVVSIQVSAQTKVRLKDGTSVEGALKANEPERIVIAVTGAPERTIAVKDITPRSVHTLMALRTPASDGRGRLAAAAFAVEHGLYTEARRDLAVAVEADDGLIEEAHELRSRMHEAQARELLDRAKKAIANNRLREADRLLTRAVTNHAETAAAAEAVQLRAEVEETVAAALRAEEAQRMGRHDEKIRDRYADVVKVVDKAHEQRRKALLTTTRYRRTLDYYGAALKNLERARKRLDKVNREPGSDRACQSCGKDILARIVDVEFETRIDLAEIFRARNSYERSLENVTVAIALDHPRVKEAKALRSTILTEREISGSRFSLRRR